MSPATLRRYRAERMLSRDFVGLRGRVLAAVRSRLRARGMSLPESDLEACYAQAWHGLYRAALEGEEILNPCAWLVLVTFRRAVEEHLARLRHDARLAPAREGGQDLDAQLDDRLQLRRLMEGLRGRLDARERQAATLCYLQGLSRAQAARQMGISERRMRKLMEGRGRGSAGVSAKVGALVTQIGEGSFCEGQASLMRAFALGLLDPRGERYQLALAHSGDCPACRRYVASLRGLAATLPPSFAGGRLAGLLGRLLHGLRGGGAKGTGAGTATGTGTAGLGAASSGAAAGGVAGGGWLAGAGPLGAKLAAGCLLAIGLGAGCAALQSRVAHAPAHRGPARLASRQSGEHPSSVAAGLGVQAPARTSTQTAPHAAPLTAAARASREFGPEQAPGDVSAASKSAAPTARAASAEREPVSGSGREGASQPSAAGQTSSGSSVQAEREFSPG